MLQNILACLHSAVKLYCLLCCNSNVYTTDLLASYIVANTGVIAS